MRAAAGLRRAWPYLLIAWLYVATSPYHRGLNNPNEMVRVYMSVAAVEDGTLAIDPVIRRWGMVDDKAVRDGALYSSKAPLQSLVGVPAYLVAKPLLAALGLPLDARHVTFVLRLLASALFGIAFSWAILAWARWRARALGAEPSMGTALGLVLALGTMAYPYSLTFTGHLLALMTAGGCFFACAALGRLEPGSRGWTFTALLAGFLAGNAPFAEYPSALVALPALAAALLMTGGTQPKLRLFGLLFAGGIAPFVFGLWSHWALWGSPFETGYGYLENPGYVEVHGKGFFGVTAPKLEAFLGTLFSPGTGLFYFSPVLALGLVPIVLRMVFGERARPEQGFGRAWAWVSLIAFALELLFISGHRGWRGGWTMGPRYIIPVVAVLGLWCIEGLGYRRLRGPLLAFGAASILLTGPAAALYPHLSDVYTNPLKSFLVPTYARGEMSYGVAHALGLVGHLANLFHLVPLLVAAVYVMLAGYQREGLAARTRTLVVTAALVTAAVVLVPEEKLPEARRENRRLWGFWEPSRKAARHARISAPPRPGRLGSARGLFRRIDVRRTGGASEQSCQIKQGTSCRYGTQDWQRFGPDMLELDGKRLPILFMHPVANETVTARVPLLPRTKAAVLRYGLADASVGSDNPHPVQIDVRQGGALIAHAEAGKDYGYQRLELPITSTAAVEVSIQVERDGARVLGWDLELYDRP